MTINMASELIFIIRYVFGLLMTKTFLSLLLMQQRRKLECLLLASLFKHVYNIS